MVQHSPPSPARTVVRPAAAAAKLAIGLSTLWLKIATDPNFPRPFKTGVRTTVFYEHELDAYLALCAGRRRGERPKFPIVKGPLVSGATVTSAVLDAPVQAEGDKNGS